MRFGSRNFFFDGAQVGFGLLPVMQPVGGSEATAEENDAVAVSGQAGIRGAVIITEGDDGAAAVGTEIFTGTEAATEQDDNASITGNVATSGAVASAEANDSAAVTGQVLVFHLPLPRHTYLVRDTIRVYKVPPKSEAKKAEGQRIYKA